MAAAIRDALGVEAELVGGDGGVFDVHLDGQLVFSKREAGRYPTEEEVVVALGA